MGLFNAFLQARRALTEKRARAARESWLAASRPAPSFWASRFNGPGFTAFLLRVLFCGGLAYALVACTMMEPPPYNLPLSEDLLAGRSYTVGDNENIYAISQNHGVKMRDIIVLNNLQPPFALQKGQVITLPAKAGEARARRTKAGAPINLLDREVAASPSYNTRPSEAPLRHAAVTAVPLSDSPVSAAPESEAPSLSAPPVQTAPTTKSAAQTKNGLPVFGWPVRGTIISVYGPKAKGLDNDGINIAAPKGSPVRAARDGVVVYAGSDMKGFGNLVLLRHEQGWVTAYAHLERIVVKKDDEIAKGSSIGTVGTTGGVSTPQLHFEIRRNGVPVDPELMIR
ncbi:MAG: M23 family metallopeptidase [Alphaproteobacteria bacterium]|nr:M23 family metallopeptidase [Alphaproteobacteria bacterium]